MKLKRKWLNLCFELLYECCMMPQIECNLSDLLFNIVYVLLNGFVYFFLRRFTKLLFLSHKSFLRNSKMKRPDINETN